MDLMSEMSATSTASARTLLRGLVPNRSPMGIAWKQDVSNQRSTVGSARFGSSQMISGRSVVFPVRDGADSYIAAVFGGTALTVPRLGDALPQYLQSIDRFASIAFDLGVNVVLQNHPLFDGMPGKLERLRDRGAGERHPFVLDAPDSYRRFMATLSECSQAQVAAAENREG